MNTRGNASCKNFHVIIYKCFICSHEVSYHFPLWTEIFHLTIELDASMLTDDVLIHMFKGSEEYDSYVMTQAVTFRVEVYTEHWATLVVRVERTAASNLTILALNE